MHNGAPQHETRGWAVGHWAWVALPLLVYAAHGLVFGAWIVDDGGIYFAYARNVAEGHGFVSQPGMEPVEGFSAPLWILFLVPFFAAGLFDPVITPKIVALVLVLGAFLCLRRVLARCVERSHTIALVALTLLAMNSYFVIWTVSGMDSPLYVFLLCALLLLTLRAMEGEIADGMTRPGTAVLVGCVAGAAALTRADGVLYSGAFPLLLVLTRLAPRDGRLGKADFVNLLAYTIAFAALYGGYFLFRVVYFGELQPNVYYSKGGPTLSTVISMLTLSDGMGEKLGDLLASAVGTVGATALVVALLAVNVWLLLSRRFSRRHGALTVFFGIATAIYMLMPIDWMGGYRFAVPFFGFFLVYTAVFVTDGIRALPLASGIRDGLAIALVVWIVGWSALAFAGESDEFRRGPTAPFARVTADARMFDGYAARLGLESGSIGLPDLGGSLYYSKLRVIDLAGLCDKKVARTLRKDTEAFHDYVFDEAKPTFVHIHGPWVHITKLHQDPRFVRDYVPIRELVAPREEKPEEDRLWVGDYVRRDAVAERADELAALQREAKVEGAVVLEGRRALWGELRSR